MRHLSIVPLKWIEYGVYGDLVIMYPKPYSIYLRGTITLNPKPNLACENRSLNFLPGQSEALFLGVWGDGKQ